MSNIFHCAVEAGNLEETVKFYTDVLFCETDNSEEGKWVDINFWGNELTLHSSTPRTSMHGERHNVEMGAVAVPHFGCCVCIGASVLARCLLVCCALRFGCSVKLPHPLRTLTVC